MIKSSRKLTKRKLRILITAGPTREYFDSVRFISNPSSGKMGYALAEAAARLGHRVVLVSGPVALPPPKGVETIQVTTAAEMLAAAQKAFRSSDAAIFTAAVSDYRPSRQLARKLPKPAGTFHVSLVSTPDIAATLGRRKGKRITLCFALEDHNGRAKAEAKLQRKHADAIVLNGPANIGSENALVEFLTQGGPWERWKLASKQSLALKLVRKLEEMTTLPGNRSPQNRKARALICFPFSR